MTLVELAAALSGICNPGFWKEHFTEVYVGNLGSYAAGYPHSNCEQRPHMFETG